MILEDLNFSTLVVAYSDQLFHRWTSGLVIIFYLLRRIIVAQPAFPSLYRFMKPQPNPIQQWVQKIKLKTQCWQPVRSNWIFTGDTVPAGSAHPVATCGLRARTGSHPKGLDLQKGGWPENNVSFTQ